MFLPKLFKYRDLLEQGTSTGQDYSLLGRTPLGRYHTLGLALKHFVDSYHNDIVELGTTRSYVNGSHPACNLDMPEAFTPEDPSQWDFGAGAFTLVVSEVLQGLPFALDTVDISETHINRCKFMTQQFSQVHHHVSSSLDYLRNRERQCDLLYIDTGDMNPINPTAEHQLAEVKVIVQRDLVSPNGQILIDDVCNTTPLKFGETSKLGKAKYSIPYLLSKGWKIIADEYQVLLRRK